MKYCIYVKCMVVNKSNQFFSIASLFYPADCRYLCLQGWRSDPTTGAHTLPQGTFGVTAEELIRSELIDMFWTEGRTGLPPDTRSSFFECL